MSHADKMGMQTLREQIFWAIFSRSNNSCV